MNELVNKLKALGDETRFKIFLLLSEKNICVKGLAKAIGISESGVSQHLKILKEANLIKGEKVGYFVHYKVQKNVLLELQGLIGELASGDLESIKKNSRFMDTGCRQGCLKK